MKAPSPSLRAKALPRRLAGRACGTLLIVALQAQSAAQAADLSQQMAGMFGSGSLANVTGPGAYRGQTQNIYTGGELQLRFPSRSYQYWSFSLPSVKAGCGGVDAYLGSFTHISKAQFKDMLQAVAQSYEGLLFKAALKSINPLIESVIGDVQKTLESVSQSNGNSCAMAQALLDATSTATGMTAQNSCVSAAMNVFGDDLAAASSRCKLDQVETTTAAKNSTDPATKALADRDMNLVWEALSGSSLSADEKTVFMNIAGTIVIYKPGNNANVPRTPMEHAPGVDSLNSLLFGDEPGNTLDTVRLNGWMTCQTADCLQVTRGALEVTPFTTQVRLMMESIRDAVVARTPLTPAQVNFINMTSVPIYRLILAGYAGGSGARNAELIDILINRYAKVTAYDYAYAYMRKALKDVRVYLGMALLRNKVEEAQSRRLIDNVDRFLVEIDREHGKVLGQVREASAVVDDLQRIERDMRATLPGSIRGMLDISNLIRGGSGRG
jgi:conjugative transfer pilus assembly protein TraH